MSSTSCENGVRLPTTGARLVWNHALAMGGSNQMIFLITALFVGQGAILGQGSAAVPLLIFGVLLGWAAAPAWTELVMMWPNRVGGISAACAEAFRPYNRRALGVDGNLLLVEVGFRLCGLSRAPLGLSHASNDVPGHLEDSGLARAAPVADILRKWVARLAASRSATARSARCAYGAARARTRPRSTPRRRQAVASGRVHRNR